MATLKDTTISDTEFLKLPVGTTNQRPFSSNAGMIRFNTDEGYIEWYSDVHASWPPISVVPPIATGGTVTEIFQDGIQYRVHTFTSNGTFEVTRGGEVEYLIVAGGGGGGYGSGAGAGGLVFGQQIIGVSTEQVIVGQGGQGGAVTSATSGTNSQFLDVIAIGGGGASDPALSGGSGAGGRSSGSNKPPGSGLQPSSSSGGFGNVGGQNNTGDPAQGVGTGGSGGGAGAPGLQPADNISGTDGGAGKDYSSYFGTGVGDDGWFAGGGGSTNAHVNTFPPDSVGGIGGKGGGGNGAPRSEINAQPNTGGGGGGGIPESPVFIGSGSGGSGIVIVRYRIG